MKLLLLSNSTNPGEDFLSYASENIIQFLHGLDGELLFIPYAAVGFDFDDYYEKVNSAFTEMGFKINSIHRSDNPKKAVAKSAGIVVGGGNTFALLNRIYENDLLDVIREKVHQGIPYIGWSAGSNLTCPTIMTTNDMPIVQPPSFDSLDLIPFQINPHYTEGRIPNHGGEGRKDRILEFTALSKNIPVVGLPEGNILQIHENQLKLIGPNEIKVFTGDQEKVHYQEEDISYLLG